MEDEAPVGPRRGWWPAWLGRAVFESLLIVFSLLLALALNNWNEDRQTANRVAETRTFFAEEIAANRARLSSDVILPHHRRLHRQLVQALGGPEPDPGAVSQALEAAFRTGIHPYVPRDAVWRSVSSGPLLAQMDPREVFALAGAYRVQEELTAVNRAMYATILAEDLEASDPRALRRRAQVVRSYLSDVTAIEAELEQSYGALLRVLERPRR